MTRLKELRTSKKLTQSALAKICKVTQGMVSGWEKGIYQIDNETLKFLADYFKVSVDYIICHDYCMNGVEKLKILNRMSELRNSNKLSQRQLAKILNVTQPMVSGWEKGIYQIDNETLKVLADYFEVTTDYLLGRDQEPPNKKAPTDLAKILINEDLTLNGITLSAKDKERILRIINAFYGI